MPIYEYECTNCRFCFEIKQGFDAEPIASCPHCQQKARRVIRALPVIFKGSGFYVTDNRRGSPVTTTEPLKETPKETPKDTTEKKPEPVAKKSEGSNTAGKPSIG